MQGPADGALIITTPQDVAIIDVRKEVSFCKKTNLPVLGVVENMSGLSVPIANLQFKSPQGDDLTNDVMTSLPLELRSCLAVCQVFEPTSGGAEVMAASMGVPFLGRVPLDPQISKLCEAGISIQSLPSSNASVEAFNAIVEGEHAVCLEGLSTACVAQALLMLSCMKCLTACTGLTNGWEIQARPAD